MIFPEISLEEWMARFPGLAPVETACGCGRKGSTTKPVIMKDWVGLALPACPCGDEVPGLTVKASNSKLQSEMDSLF